MSLVRLALALLWRDRRAGELALLVFALAVAVASSSATALFADRLQRTMALQTAEFLAADLVIAADRPVPADWLAQARQLGLAEARTLEFSSVLVEQDMLLLVSVKAVSAAYPLRGHLQTATLDLAAATRRRHGPPPGEAWVEARVLPALGLALGQTLKVGDKPLVVSQVLTYEPDKRGDFYSFSPRVMIHEDDLAATGLVQPGSHVHHFFLFAGDKEAVAAFADWLRPRLAPSQRLLDIRTDRPELGAALERAQRYLGLSSLLVVVIAGVAIAITVRRYSEHKFDTVALLRCFGLRRRDIVGLMLVQFLALGLLAAACGCLVGWQVHESLFALLRGLLPPVVAEPGPRPVLFGFATSLALLFGFALPPLLRLWQVSPLRVLRRELAPLPVGGWLVYGLALAVVGGLVWWHTADPAMTAILLGVGAAALSALAGLVYAALGWIARAAARAGLGWRFGLKGLVRDRHGSVGQVLAFAVTVAAMMVSFTVRNDLLADWQRQLPEHAPNHFALNVFPRQLDDFRQELARRQIAASRFYPVVRGRLASVNGRSALRLALDDTHANLAIRREMSLTWAPQLPEQNLLVAGRWWEGGGQAGWVSVEQELAEGLGIRLGDELGFVVGAQSFSAKVASIRALRWDTMLPNFYVVFSPGTLDAFPSMYLTSFYLPKHEKHQLNALAKRYPNITLLEVDAIVRQLQTIVRQLSQALDHILYFAVLAGFVVLLAAVSASLDARVHESALMRALGARRRLLVAAHVLEFGGLGLLAGLLAVALAEAVTYALYAQALRMPYQPDPGLWLGVPLAVAVVVAVVGGLSVRQVLRQPPLVVLRG